MVSSEKDGFGKRLHMHARSAARQCRAHRRAYLGTDESMNRQVTWGSWLRPGLAGCLLFLAAWAVLPPPSPGLLVLAVGAPEVGQWLIVAAAGDHLLELNVRFRNLSNQPIILAYQGTSGLATDEYGNRYNWGRPGTHDMSASGIGSVDASKADPGFVLSPGEAREGKFHLRRFNTTGAIGALFSYDLTIQQLEILPGGQIRKAREYAVGFHDLTGAGGAAPLGNADVGKAGKSLLDELRNRLGKKR